MITLDFQPSKVSANLKGRLGSHWTLYPTDLELDFFKQLEDDRSLTITSNSCAVRPERFEREQRREFERSSVELQVFSTKAEIGGRCDDKSVLGTLKYSPPFTEQQMDECCVPPADRDLMSRPILGIVLGCRPTTFLHLYQSLAHPGQFERKVKFEFQISGLPLTESKFHNFSVAPDSWSAFLEQKMPFVVTDYAVYFRASD